MAGVPIGSISLGWLPDPDTHEEGTPGAPGENLLHALHRHLWSGVVAEAEKAVSEDYEGSAKEEALKSVAAVSSLSRAKAHSDPTIAKKIFRQLSEVEFRKGALDSLAKVYLRGVKHIGLSMFEPERLSLLQGAITKLLFCVENLFAAVEGNIFSKIPFCVFSSFFYVLSRYGMDMKKYWWQDKDNRLLFVRVAKAHWPGTLPQEEKFRVENGARLLMRLCNLCFEFLGDEDLIILSSESILENMDSVRSQLLNGCDDDDDCKLVYYNEQENAAVIDTIKAVDSDWGASMEIQHNTSLQFAKARHARTKKGKITAREELTEMSVYFDKTDKAWYSSVIASQIVISGANVIRAAISSLSAIRHHPYLREDLKKLRRMDGFGEVDGSLKEEAIKLVEIMRMAVLLHDRGANVSKFVEISKIGAAFIDRIDRDGTLILSREKKRKYRDLAAAQEEIGAIFSEDSDISGSEEEE